MSQVVLPRLLAPFVVHPASFSSGADLADITTICCISLQVMLGFASRARAHMPAAKGADADVPEEGNTKQKYRVL